MAQATYSEKESQTLYEDMLADAAAKREADVKAIASKQKAKVRPEKQETAKQMGQMTKTSSLNNKCLSWSHSRSI